MKNIIIYSAGLVSHIGAMKFKGDLEHLETVHTNKIVQILQENGFSGDATITVQPIGQKGDNYVACVQRILAEDSDGKTLKMVAKIAPSQEILRQMMQIELLFTNEVVMYTEILPSLAKLQNSLDIPEEDKLKFPACYGTVTEAPNELILLEDLKTQNFVIRDRMISLTNGELRIVLKKLATLHSLSYVLRGKDPELFLEYSSKLRNMWTSDIMNQSYLGPFENGIIQFLQEEEYKTRTRGTLTQLQRMALQMGNIDMTSKYSVIIHGDCWTNNLMFRFEENQPVDCIPIDYQVSRVCSPAIELIYLIFNCSDRETRSKHYFEWLDYYHKALDDSLANFGLKGCLVYPRDRFDADLRRYGKLGYAVSLMLANALMRESAETIDMNDMGDPEKIEELLKTDALGLGNCKEETVLKIGDRFNELCASFIEYGYI